MNFVKLNQCKGADAIQTPVMVHVSHIVSIEPYLDENLNGDILSRSKVWLAFGSPIYAIESVVEVLNFISEVEKR